MTTAKPATGLTCSLSPAQLRERRASARAHLVPHITSVERKPRRVMLRFDAGIRTTVEEFVALEQQCCGFLDFAIAPSTEPLTLTIEGPEGSEATLDLFANAARPSGP